MRIALFGGKFDPPHKAHIEIADNIIKHKVADRVWFLPANTHPWRAMHASPGDRLNMLQFLEKPYITSCDVDIKRGGNTYTIDTVKILQATTKHTYIWICGADQIQQLKKWKDYQQLQKRIEFFVFPREQVAFPKDIAFTPLPKLTSSKDCSSSIIREKIKQGQSLDDLVLPGVKEYI